MSRYVNISVRRVGGLLFIKVGRLCVSFCITRSYRDLNAPKRKPLPAPKDAGRFRTSIDGVLVLGYTDEA